MTALSKFLVLLAIFLSASSGDAFVNHAQLNHLFRFDASKSNPTNKPSCIPSYESTRNQMNDQTTKQGLEWNAELSNVLSSNRVKYSLLSRQDATFPSKTTVTQNTLSERVTFRASVVDDEIQTQSLYSQNTQIPIGKGQHKEVSRSARVPFSTIYPFGGLSPICSFGGLSCMVHSHAVKVPAISSNELPAGLGLRSANSRAGCIASAQTSGLHHTQTNDSPAKQQPVPNDDPAIDISLQLCVPTIPTVSATSTAISTHIVAITTELNGQDLLLLCAQDNPAITMTTHEQNLLLSCVHNDSTNTMTMATHVKLLLLHCVRDDLAIMMATHANLLLHSVRDDLAIMMATHAKLKLQLIVEFIRNALDARIQQWLIVVLHSKRESDGRKLIVDSILTRAVQTNHVTKIFLHICDDCRIFREGEWEKYARNDGLFGRLVSPNFGFVRFVGFVGFIGFVDFVGFFRFVGFVGFGSFIGFSGFVRFVSLGLIVSVRFAGFIGFVGFVSFVGFSLIVSVGTAAATKISWRRKHAAARGVATTRTSATGIADAAIMLAASSSRFYLIAREKMMFCLLALYRKNMWWWICSFGNSYYGDALQYSKQIFSGRLPQMTKYCVMRECENILRGYLCVFDLVFSHMMEFTVLNSQASFWRSLAEISLPFDFAHLN